jgi:hypothetical protein
MEVFCYYRVSSLDYICDLYGINGRMVEVKILKERCATEEWGRGKGVGELKVWGIGLGPN